MPLCLIKRHFGNDKIWVKFIQGKLSLISSEGFFPSFRAGRLLRPTNTMSVDVNALYSTHTSQSQLMLKKVELAKNWDILSSRSPSARSEMGFFFHV